MTPEERGRLEALAREWRAIAESHVSPVEAGKLLWGHDALDFCADALEALLADVPPEPAPADATNNELFEWWYTRLLAFADNARSLTDRSRIPVEAQREAHWMLDRFMAARLRTARLGVHGNPFLQAETRGEPAPAVGEMFIGQPDAELAAQDRHPPRSAPAAGEEWYLREHMRLDALIALVRAHDQRGARPVTEDTERLDWLEANPDVEIATDDMPFCWRIDRGEQNVQRCTLREAIDAARVVPLVPLADQPQQEVERG